MNYTSEQKQFLHDVQKKIIALFDMYPSPAHGFDHAARVAERARQIAEVEGVDPFLCELSGWLHDVGRAPESHNQNPDNKRHHELSYDMLRVWFREEPLFAFLTPEQKIELLYGIRYHWNDVADEYKSAIILRDADKIDAIGHVGLERAHECFGDDTKEFTNNFRYLYQFAYWFKTETAKQMVKEERMYEPLDKFYTKMLQDEIKPVEL